MYCTSCRQQKTIVYVLVKKAFHIFWIPLVPAGSSTYMTCPDCGSIWKMTKVPLDMSYWGYLLLSIGLLLGGVIISILASLACLTSLVFVILPIFVSIAYLYTVPSSHREHFENVTIDALSAGLGAGAIPPSTAGYTDPYSAPRTVSQYSAPNGINVPSSPMAGSIYATAGSSFTSCPSCGMRMETPPPGIMVTCPYCKSTYRR